MENRGCPKTKGVRKYEVITVLDICMIYFYLSKMALIEWQPASLEVISKSLGLATLLVR